MADHAQRRVLSGAVLSLAVLSGSLAILAPGAPAQTTRVQPTLVQPTLVQPTLVQPTLVQKVKVQSAKAQTPEAQTPEAQTPEAQTPEAQTPEGGAGCTQAPTRASADPAASLVLSASDVGPGYRTNTAVSGIRTLSEVSYGDTAPIVRDLDADWLGGSESAFNGPSIGIISVADVFRPGTPVDAVLRAWQDDAQAFTGGGRQQLPSGVPGGDPALISGTVVNYGVLIFMWRNGRVIATLELTGKPAKLRVSLLMELVRRQEARISRAGPGCPKHRSIERGVS